jgi:hypothetical protein
VSGLDRCHNCGWAESNNPAAPKTGPQIAQRDGVAYWRGVQTCGSIWACPVCQAKIRNGRAIEISEFTAEWIRRGGEVYMVTLTAPHDLGMALSLLMALISNAFTAVIGGRAWVGLRDQLGIAGTIRALEVTHGEHGWHPHLHTLVYCRDPLDAPGLAAFTLHFQRKWHRFVTKAGYRAPHGQHGVKVERCYNGTGAADYICKTQDGKNPGNEMARSDMKTSRTGHRMPFDILEAAGTGERAELELWWEYEQATFRRKAITWGRSLLDLRKQWLNAEEQTDDELAAPEVDGDTVADVMPSAIRRITCIPGLRARLLDACEAGGLDGLAAVASVHGFILLPGRAGRPPLLCPARKRKADDP